MNDPHDSACTHRCPSRCSSCRDASPDGRIEATGAVVLVLEAGAGWPPSFEAHRHGHADVVVVAQQSGEGTKRLLRRVRARVAELRLSGRCARTAIFAAEPEPGPHIDVTRALLARSLLGSLCSGCGELWLVAEAGQRRLHRHLEGLAAALREGSYGRPIAVLVEEMTAEGGRRGALGAV